MNPGGLENTRRGTCSWCRFHRERLAELRVAHLQDHRVVAGFAQVLAEELEEGRRWVAPESLLDGGATAFPKQWKPVEARAIFAPVVPLTSRSVGDLRSRPLVAHLDLVLSPR
jgi:hypothetical protein